MSNTLGWTALHEACFYNRIEVVKVLMLSGANATLRTRSGALPYHFAGLQIIKNMLKDMGGTDAVPAEDDVIDMAIVMKEISNDAIRCSSMKALQGQPQQQQAMSRGSDKNSKYYYVVF